MKTEQLSFIEIPPKDNTDKNAKLRWENGFQRWSDEQAGGNDYYGKCGCSNICDYCTDNTKGRPCERALSEMCRDRNIKLDYTKKRLCGDMGFMKTKQEQIEQMIKIFTDNREVCQHMRCVECKYHGDEECMYSSYAYSLYQAGYGDVSEYKAEIERLRTTLGQCNTELNSALESLKSQCREIGALKAGTKQAKIDVLNELKKKTHNYYPSIDSYCISQHVVLVRDIDELIEEVQNGEDKS